jgi:hypothetical protein
MTKRTSRPAPCLNCAGLQAERNRLCEALKLCAAVLSGAELSKGALVRALEAAQAALGPDTARESREAARDRLRDALQELVRRAGDPGVRAGVFGALFMLQEAAKEAAQALAKSDL